MILQTIGEYTKINNYESHNERISKYNSNNAQEALELIYNLNISDFNNYGQMVKDIKKICLKHLPQKK